MSKRMFFYSKVKFKDCVDEEPTTVLDITMQITESWDDAFADQATQLFKDLAKKYGDKFDKVLKLVDGFTGSAISQFWQKAKDEEGKYFSLESMNKV